MTRVLIVDDEPDIRDTLQEFLADAGFAVTTAANGAIAMDQLTEERPCLVILDLIMPVLDGNEVIERMRESEELAEVPIVITTSDPARAPAGIPVMKKPMNLNRLLTVVRAHCDPDHAPA
jgi:DNA-binding response OmpR family regulator